MIVVQLQISQQGLNPAIAAQRFETGFDFYPDKVVIVRCKTRWQKLDRFFLASQLSASS